MSKSVKFLISVFIFGILAFLSMFWLIPTFSYAQALKININPTDSTMFTSLSNAVALKLDDKISNIKVKHRGLHLKMGDVESDSLTEQFELSAWDGESTMKIHLPKYIGTEHKRPQKNNDLLHPGAIFDHTDNYYSEIYYNNGGIEWDLHFEEKPDTNQWRFNIETDGLILFYQDSAWVDSVTEGWYDDDVLYSYAAYCGKFNNHRNIVGKDTTEEYYYAGKVFHIYRPLAIDNLFDSAWCSIRIDQDSGFIELTAPQKYLDNANYPMRIDPYFGKDTVGASPISVSDYQLNANWSNTAWPSGNITGTTDSLFVSHVIVSGTHSFKGYVYDYDATVANCDLLDSTEEHSEAAGGGQHTQQLALTMGYEPSAVPLIVVMQAEGGAAHRVYGDAVTSGFQKFVADTDFDPPTTLSGASDGTTGYSMWVKYTTNGAPTPLNARRRRLIQESSFNYPDTVDSALLVEFGFEFRDGFAISAYNVYDPYDNPQDVALICLEMPTRPLDINRNGSANILDLTYWIQKMYPGGF